ncbi:hypothetical protein EOPP23_19235 [Endozoicomonas sp. OPT23]|uniref:hypothetical protein n=1 Tax=Endozoicomonas sp. OPT23 TaxID=2072845 RepID=UPI001890D5FC|nr:hypothetical protein [Endozoicomonas sp. OPT23]MRI35103.1 hypothetical protein [Endozoicomonas sp. OPT23]
MQILKSRVIRCLIVPQLMAAMVVGQVWASPQIIDADTSTAITISGPNNSDDTVVEPEDGVTVNQGRLLETTNSDPTILINTDDVFTGTVLNNGHIDDGIVISGNVTSSATDGVVKIENTNSGEEASLHDGLIINSNKTVSSSMADTVYIGESGYIDFITVTGGSTLSASGTGNHAIDVHTQGQIGGDFNNSSVGGGTAINNRSETDTIIDASGTIGSDNGSAINIDGTATGKIAITGTVSGTENTTGGNSGAITIGGTYTGMIENTGEVRDAIVVTGTHSSSSDAIKSTGTLGNSTSETAIKVGSDGSVTTTSPSATVYSINLGGTINGSIVNNGEIDDGILISGTQTATGSAYQSSGSAGNVARVLEGLTISGTADTTGTEPTVSIGNYSTVDTITVTNSGILRNTGSNGVAIVVGNQGAEITNGIVNDGTITGDIDNDGLISGGIDNNNVFTGNIENSGTINGGIDNSSTAFTGNIANEAGGTINGVINNSGTITGNITNDGTINNGFTNSGTLTGSIDNNNTFNGGIDSTGTITGYIDNSGNITGGVSLNDLTAAGASAYNSSVAAGSTASLVGGLTINGTVTSDEDTIVLGDNASIDNITVSNGATLSTTGAVGDGDPNIDGNAIRIDTGGTISGNITNSGTITGNIANAGTITGGITSTGTFTGVIKNTGSIGSITVQDQTPGSESAYSSTGTATLNSYTVNGNVTTTHADAVSIGAGTSAGTITIATTGSLTGATNVINNMGTITGGITSNGTLNGNINNTASGVISGPISISGALNGTLTNSGSISSGLTVSFTDTAASSIYSSSGSGSLTGGLTIDGAITSSAAAGAIVIGDGTTTNTNSIDTITVNSGDSLTATGTDNKAIVVTANNQISAGIRNSGSINGSIVNSGTISGGIETAGKSGVGSAYIGENGSVLAGGFEVTGGTVTSTDSDTVHVKSGATVDSIEVSGGTLSASGVGNNAIQIDDGAILGDGTPVESEALITIGGGATVSSAEGTGINIETDLTGKILINTGGTLNGSSATGSLVISTGKTLTGSIENNGLVTGKVHLIGNLAATNDAIDVGLTGRLGSTEADTIIEVDGNLSSSAGDAIKIEGDSSGRILVNGAISDGQINITNDGDYRGTVDIEGGSVADGFSLAGTHISSGTGINITNGGSVGSASTSSGSAIHITSTGSLSSQASNGIAINLTGTGSTLTGSIHNEGIIVGGINLSGIHAAANEAIINTGTINGDLAINNSQNNSPSGSNSDIRNEGTINGDITVSGNPTLVSSSRSAYYSVGTSGDRSLLNGTYQLSSNRTVSSTTDTVKIGEYSDIKKIGISVGAVLSSTGSNKRAIYIAEDASLGTTNNEADVVLQVNGELSSTQGSALEVEGDITGAILVSSTGLISGRGGSTDAAILFDSSDSSANHQAVIQNHGVIKGKIYIDTNQTLTTHSAYRSSGSNTDWAVLSGVDNNGRGYTVDDGATVTSANNTVSVGSYSYIDSILVEGSLHSTGASSGSIYIGANGQLGGTLATTKVGSGHLSSDIIRSVTDTVIDISSSGSLIANSGSAIKIDGRVTGVISNRGTIGGALVVGSTGTLTGDIANYGTMTGFTNNGSFTGDFINDERVTGNIVTSGTFSGDILNRDRVEGGIVINSGSMSGAVTNSGVMSNGGFGVNAAGSFSGNFTNSGSITGNTVISGTMSGNILNSGTQTGNISTFGSHNGLIKNTGTLTGNIVSAGTRNGDISNTNNLTGNITVSGITTGAINNTGQMTGDIIIANTGRLNGNVINSGTVNGTIQSMGTLNGQIINRDTLGLSSSSNVIDFTGAASALNLMQDGSSADIRGRITGSSHDDTVNFREGSFNGNLSAVEHLVISDDSDITIDGDFTLPEKTSIYLDSSLDASQSLITASGTAFAEATGSTLNFMPEDNEAYLSLYNNGPVVTVVDAQAIDGSAMALISADSGSALLQTRVYSENGDIKVEIKASTSEDVNGVMGQALLAALHEDAHPDDSHAVISNLNRSEEVVGELEDDVRPDTSGSTHTAPRAITMATQSIVFDRINSLRGSGLNFGDDGFGFGLYGNSYESGESSAQQASDEAEDHEYSINTSQKRDRQIRHMDYTLLNGGSFWGQMMFLEGNQDAKPSTDGYNNRAGGVVLGIDTILLDRFRLGVAATYGYGVVNTENDRSTESHNFLGTVYGSMERGNLFADVMFSGGTASNSVDQVVRNVRVVSGNPSEPDTFIDEKVTGDYNSYQWNLKSVVGYRFALGSSWEFTPLAELNYGKVYFESYKPKGHPIHPDKIDIHDYSALELGLGFTIKGLINSGKQYIEPDFTLMMHRDLQTTGSKVEYSFLGIDAQEFLKGPARDSQRYKASFGLYFDMGSNWYIRTGYDYNWSQTYRSHGLNAKFRYDF